MTNRQSSVSSRRSAATGVLLAVALAVGACSGASTDDATTPAAPAPTAESSAASETRESGTTEPAESTESTPNAEATDALDSSYSVTVVDEGMKALVRSGEEADSDVEQVTGRLIIGPGACFSLEPGSQPHLLIFEQGTGFHFHGQRPYFEVGATRLAVGELATFEVAPIPVDGVQGVSHECAAGAETIAYEVRSVN